MEIQVSNKKGIINVKGMRGAPWKNARRLRFDPGSGKHGFESCKFSLRWCKIIKIDEERTLKSIINYSSNTKRKRI